MHGIVRLWPAFLLFILLSLAHAAPSESAAPAGGEKERLFAFAAALMDEGDYYRAITEYKRFIAYFPDDERIPLCRLNIALAYRKGGKTELALEILQQIEAAYYSTPIAEKAHYERGLTNAASGRHEEAAAAFSEYLLRYPDSIKRDDVLERLGWSLVHLWRLDRAAEAFSSVGDKSPHYALAKALAAELRGDAEIPRKSPVVAGTLSAVLPGAGQFYTKRPREGITSFLLNGSFIWAIVSLFDHSHEVAGFLLGFFEIGWYSGGIFGAVNDAHKFNRRARQDYIADLKNRYPFPARD
jgi:tetratricopeptide (TPR) repeat protein